MDKQQKIRIESIQKEIDVKSKEMAKRKVVSILSTERFENETDTVYASSQQMQSPLKNHLNDTFIFNNSIELSHFNKSKLHNNTFFNVKTLQIDNSVHH